MKNLLHNWWVRALLIGSLVTAPWVAMAAYNIDQAPNGATGFLNNLSTSGIHVMTFLNGRVVQTTGARGTGNESWAFDEKEYVLSFSDITVAQDAVLVVDETGTIMSVSVAWTQTLTGSNATLTLFRIASGGNFSGPTTVSAYSGTTTTATSGAKISDDTIFQAVNRGDVIALQTDGAPSNASAVFAGITIRIRANPAQQ